MFLRAFCLDACGFAWPKLGFRAGVRWAEVTRPAKHWAGPSAPAGVSQT